MKLLTPDAPATKRQLWYLHILTKTDTRNLGLTMAEASKRISAHIISGEVKPDPKPKVKRVTKLMHKRKALAPKPIEPPKPIEQPIPIEYTCRRCGALCAPNGVPVREGYGMRIVTCDACADKILRDIERINSVNSFPIWDKRHNNPAAFTPKAPSYHGNGYGYLGHTSWHRGVPEFVSTTEPLCGHDWLNKHIDKWGIDGSSTFPIGKLTVLCDGQAIGTFSQLDKRGEVKATMKGVSDGY